jgi:hypothetical protein
VSEQASKAAWVAGHVRRIVHRRCLSRESYVRVSAAALDTYDRTGDQFAAIRAAREVADMENRA